MVVAERIQFLKHLVRQQRVVVITQSPNAINGRLKFKMTVQPGSSILPRFMQEASILALDAIEQLSHSLVSVDRGHKHTNGFLEVCIWMQARKSTVPTNDIFPPKPPDAYHGSDDAARSDKGSSTQQPGHDEQHDSSGSPSPRWTRCDGRWVSNGGANKSSQSSSTTSPIGAASAVSTVHSAANVASLRALPTTTPSSISIAQPAIQSSSTLNPDAAEFVPSAAHIAPMVNRLQLARIDPPVPEGKEMVVKHNRLDAVLDELLPTDSPSASSATTSTPSHMYSPDDHSSAPPRSALKGTRVMEQMASQVSHEVGISESSCAWSIHTVLSKFSVSVSFARLPVLYYKHFSSALVLPINLPLITFLSRYPRIFQLEFPDPGSASTVDTIRVHTKVSRKIDEQGFNDMFAKLIPKDVCGATESAAHLNAVDALQKKHCMRYNELDQQERRVIRGMLQYRNQKFNKTAEYDDFRRWRVRGKSHASRIYAQSMG
eukprot:gnl/TRDRNA2_/TRDRNA2_38029_c0_seq1.p1 gnl/TRDRNA2_/TRDRNA2_38029_c0~~gnl/TRDRNA2_/TRDRNA2_38029_c0_seq1.p1  ORF type:complete len:489 (+),score=28.73 gnl/TRDRNA2_/TRDRNA2_38029_c0_seq1:76-1542(+)